MEADKFLAVRFTRLEVSPASLPNTVKHTKVRRHTTLNFLLLS